MSVRACGSLAFLVAILFGAQNAAAKTPTPIKKSRRTITVPSPCPGPSCPEDLKEPQALGLRIVYLNFDGVSLTASNNQDNATTNTSAIAVRNMTISAFNPNDLYSTSGLSRSQIIQRVVDDLYASHNPYNVQFVTERPASGNYSMVVFGGSCEGVAEQACAGIALRDCGDFFPANITFVFPWGLRVGDLAATAAQEAAHAFGLGHTNDTTDIMYPEIQGFIPTSFGSGNIPDNSGCGGASFQNSHQLMLDTIGFRGQDALPPAVSIQTPRNNDIVGPGWPVSATISDDTGVVRAELLVNNVLSGTLTSPPWNFTLPDPIEDGQTFVAVQAFDSSDNSGFSRVSVIVDNNVDMIDEPLPGQLGATCAGADQCNSGLCAEKDAEMRCSQSCNAATPCPDGFDCISDTACWPAEGGGGGCAVGSRSGASTGFALALVFGLIALRRRRA